MIKPKCISQCIAKATILLFFCYFFFWWVYKLDVLPGLHGDEAWFGLKANEFLTRGVDHIYGMNTYTGILQPFLSFLIFKGWGIGIIQLRIGGCVFNLLALFIIYCSLESYRVKRSGIVFLLMFAQSALYQVSPRVAWEVNTFTLFFISLLTAAVMKVMSDIQTFRSTWIWLFLFVNLMGSYNHMIFSCLSIAGLFGVGLWTASSGNPGMIPVIRLLIVNLLNLLLLFIFMKYYSDIPVLRDPFVFILILIILPFFETIGLKKIFMMRFPVIILPKVSDYIIYGLLSAFLLSFFVFHGLALYQVISNYKVITHAYSYRFSTFIQLIFLATGLIVCYYFFLFLIEDLRNGETSLFSFFIISYLGIFTLYTTRCSFRYYLCIYIIISIYVSIKTTQHMKQAAPLLVALGVTILAFNFSLFQIFNTPRSFVKPIYVQVGNSNQLETSAHFLPNKPLIDFLQANKISDIRYLKDRYFLEQPVLFYNLISPREQCPGNIATVGYDYSGNSKGGYLCEEKIVVSN